MDRGIGASRAGARMTDDGPLRVGATARLDFRVTSADMAAFAALSGDVNPLHADDAYARRCGFRGRVVYGGLLVAAVSRLLGTRLPGPGCVWHRLSIDFRAPLYLGEPAELSATVRYCNAELALMQADFCITVADREIARGTAQAGCPGERQ